MTFGLGPALFDERFGLARQRPAPLRDLPALPGDELDRERSGGDLCVQACADDPQVAFHAVRNLARIGRGAVTVRWSQLGFGRTSSTSRAQDTPRNLMGFKDGTANLKAEDVDALARHVWVAGDRRGEPAWLRDGTYLVARRIRMLIEVWDRTSLGDQEQTIGRHKASGAPLGESDEFATLKVDRLPADSHVRLAAPSSNDGGGAPAARLLVHRRARRPPRPARRRALLPVLPARPGGVRPLQRRLGADDALNEYIKHVGGGRVGGPARRPARRLRGRGALRRLAAAGGRGGRPRPACRRRPSAGETAVARCAGLGTRVLVVDAEQVMDERVRRRAARAEDQRRALAGVRERDAAGRTKPSARSRRIISSAVGAETPTLRATSACVGAPAARSRSRMASR